MTAHTHHGPSPDPRPDTAMAGGSDGEQGEQLDNGTLDPQEWVTVDAAEDDTVVVRGMD